MRQLGQAKAGLALWSLEQAQADRELSQRREKSASGFPKLSGLYMHSDVRSVKDPGRGRFGPRDHHTNFCQQKNEKLFSSSILHFFIH